MARVKSLVHGYDNELRAVGVFPFSSCIDFLASSVVFCYRNISGIQKCLIFMRTEKGIAMVPVTNIERYDAWESMIGRNRHYARVTPIYGIWMVYKAAIGTK
jgi:hypothetical protein